MLRSRTLAAMLLLASLAGCLEGDRATDEAIDRGAGPGAPADDGSGTATWRLGGSFTENATQAEIAEIGRELEPYNATMRVMESFPMQYAVDGLTLEVCPEVRALLAEKPYVAVVRECEPDVPPEEPDQPVSDANSTSP